MNFLLKTRLCSTAIGILAGVLIFSIGIYYCNIEPDMIELLQEARIPQMTSILLLVGFIVVVLSCLSLLHCVQNDDTVKYVYCTVLGIFIILFLIAMIRFFSKRRTYTDNMAKEYDELWDDREDPSNHYVLDYINLYFHCCGPYSPNNYKNDTPPSCCGNPVHIDCTPDNSIYKNGCRQLVINYAASKVDCVGSAATITALTFSFIVFLLLFYEKLVKVS